MTTYEPVPNDEAMSLIGEGVHTGLRKGTDQPSSTILWRAIRDSNDGAWGAALEFCIEGLESMGYKLCKEVK